MVVRFRFEGDGQPELPEVCPQCGRGPGDYAGEVREFFFTDCEPRELGEAVPEPTPETHEPS
jgi:hypothetical protein